jgi:hypothetical protein
MSLVTDCLAAGGTLGIAIGSGLQAASELRRYKATVRKLGFTEAANAVAELLEASMRFFAMLWVPWSLWPGFSWSIWRLRSNALSFFQANQRYFKDFRALGSAEITDTMTKADRDLAQELGYKSSYWFLIMVGTLVVFAGAVIGIVSDVT